MGLINLRIENTTMEAKVLFLVMGRLYQKKIQEVVVLFQIC